MAGIERSLCGFIVVLCILSVFGKGELVGLFASEMVIPFIYR